MKKIKRFGFTLVELIIVITILVILVSIGTLKFRQYPGQARDAARAVDLKQIEQALEFYALKNGDYPAPEPDGTIGEQTYKLLEKLPKLPLDPSGEKYTYKLVNGEPVLGAKVWETYKPEGREGTLKQKNSGGTTPTIQGTSENTQSGGGSQTQGGESQGGTNQAGTTTGDTGSSSASSGQSSSQTNTQTIASRPTTNSTFTEVTNTPLGTVNRYYIQSGTNLKWDSITKTDIKWARGTKVPEPLWDGEQYDFEKEGALNKDYFINPSSSDIPETIFHYCRKKGSKWRVPTKNELLSIFNYNGKNSEGYYSNLPSISNFYYYLASTVYNNNTNNAWLITFSGNYTANGGKTTKFSLICVHD